MIKINLLPTKRKPPRKVTELQKHLIIAIVVSAGVSGAMVLYYLHLNAKIAERQQQRNTAQARISQQDSMLKEVKNVEEERRKVTEKIGVIEQLKKNQQGPVRLLDEISRALPNNVNLTALTEAAHNINLDGTAFTNEDVVKFIDNLKASPYLDDVYLLETVQASAEGFEFYRYKLQFRYKGL